MPFHFDSGLESYLVVLMVIKRLHISNHNGSVCAIVLAHQQQWCHFAFVPALKLGLD